MRQELGVVILGASKFDYLDSEQEGGEPLGNPRFAESARLFHEMFEGEVVVDKPRTEILDLFDRIDPPNEIMTKVSEFASHGNFDDLVVYFCGHGVIPLHMNYIGYLRRTKKPGLNATALKIKDLLRDLSDSVAGRNIRIFTVLDACFSGHVIKEMALGAQDASRGESLLDQIAIDTLPGKGAAIYCACPANTFALAPQKEKTTLFTGAIVDILKQGLASRRDAPHLSWRDIRGPFFKPSDGEAAKARRCHACTLWTSLKVT